MGNLSRLEMEKILKRLILFAAELEDIESTESIGDGTNNNNASSSPENSDDFVLVPNNLPIVDAQAYDRKWVTCLNSDDAVLKQISLSQLQIQQAATIQL